MGFSTWFPPVAALVISFFTSMAGISGAFLLLPLQMSVLGFTSPAVSATNLVFNLVATPAGVYRYWREKRVLWPLTLLVAAGTAPGVILGCLIRLTWLPDARRFKAFAGLVLLWIAVRLVLDLWRSYRQPAQPAPSPAPSKDWRARTLIFNARQLAFEFQQRKYHCRPAGIFVLSLAVGLVGGIYGIGGAAIIAPFLVSIYGLPVHTIAGATLAGTLVTSAAGVGFYQWIAPFYQASGITVAPNWTLGLSFGVGGMAGMYLGARTQRYVPAAALKTMLALILLGVATGYLAGYLRG
ncbi:MAG TPA: sulfite exporter TauE/SafE family protein [Acetobacteraceae bacterium]|nr:sulfite exporter TauE/SafE family protein [Acetobacteraceae bacterium]